MTRRRRPAGLLVAISLVVGSVATPVAVHAAEPNARPQPSLAALSATPNRIVVGPDGFDDYSQTSDAVTGLGDDEFQVDSAFGGAVTVFITDGFIVGDNYTVFLDGVPLGTTPAVPLRGPAYSFGLYTAQLTAGTHIISIQDIGGPLYFSQGATEMIPAGYFLTITYGARTKPVMFVHGWNARFDTSDWDAMILRFQDAAAGQVRRFEYYQDKGGLNGGTCQSRPVALPAAPNGGMPAHLDSIDEHVCDSSSAIGLDAVSLERDVQELSLATGQPVVIVANSMGAAIVRGFLAYSAEQHDGIAAQHVDSVFFLEGAQDGAYLAAITDHAGLLSPVENGLKQLGIANGVPDIGRPAGLDLKPESEWYEWANPKIDHLPNIAYFNAYGDMAVVIKSCVLLGPCFDVPGVGSVGDALLLPGTDDPTDTPPGGGARFLKGAPGEANWQWALHDTVAWNPWTDPFFLGVVSDIAGRPVFHGNFGRSMPQITVADCRDGASLTFDQELLRVLAERTSGDAPGCAQ